MILFDETIRQKMDDGTPMPDISQVAEFTLGSKVDTGAKELANHSGEKVPEGLDGLREGAWSTSLWVLDLQNGEQ